MQIQIVTFQLSGLTHEEYSRICEQLSPKFRRLPGLLSKTWLSHPDSNLYGGVYLWRDRESLEAYLRSEMFRTAQSNPHFTNFRSLTFNALEMPSRMTRGWAAAALAFTP